MGLMLFGLVFGFLALAHDQLLFQSPFLLVVGLAILVVLFCSARFIFSVRLSQASAFLWLAISPALRYRGPNKALQSTHNLRFATGCGWLSLRRK
jgi:hypothetical protein